MKQENIGREPSEIGMFHSEIMPYCVEQLLMTIKLAFTTPIGILPQLNNSMYILYGTIMHKYVCAYILRFLYNFLINMHDEVQNVTS